MSLPLPQADFGLARIPALGVRPTDVASIHRTVFTKKPTVARFSSRHRLESATQRASRLAARVHGVEIFQLKLSGQEPHQEAAFHCNRSRAHEIDKTKSISSCMSRLVLPCPNILLQSRHRAQCRVVRAAAGS